MSKINKISVDGLTYDIEDKSVPEWAKSSAKPTYKTSELENDSNFITEAKVDEKIANVASGGSIDLSNYATKEYVDEQISNIEVSGGSSSDIYSTEEQVIGTWIDNLPIYRKVIVTTTPTTANSWTDIAIGVDNIKEYIRYNAKFKHSGLTYFADVFEDSSHKFMAVARSNAIAIFVGESDWCSRPMTMILEYTKTTD